ncbi:Transcriptional regulator GlxA family, contains an amidase domain and an AraC-type DNA-binding HTH domain [Paracoccus pantotrophus]|nr:Transcriptional regulator GlxA family, contains an amidase domain and an AraC-type DNA-binding HTH domain [Paracoccus pantotrophus]
MRRRMTPPASIGFLLLPGYAMMSLASAIEPLRAANQLGPRPLYRLDFLAAESGFVASSVGGGFNCAALREAAADLDLLFVVAGGNPMLHDDPALIHGLRNLDRRGVRLGGISGGAAVLARHGLMEGRRFTVHWLHIEELQELAPGLLIERALYVIDRDRYTCAGGVAAFDMMCAMIASQHGAAFAHEVSDWFIHSRMRTASEPQQLDPARRYNLHHPRLEAAVRLMTTHIADPLSAAQLAGLAGCSARQLQRRFADHFGMSISDFYRNLRLEKADELLRHSALPLAEIAQLTGFATVQHFSRCFARHFGTPPARRRRDGTVGGGLAPPPAPAQSATPWKTSSETCRR